MGKVSTIETQQTNQMKFLKGKLTKLCASLVALLMTPGIFEELSTAVTEFFTDSQGGTLNLVVAAGKFVAAIGIIWGGARSAIDYGENGIGGYTLERKRPIEGFQEANSVGGGQQSRSRPEYYRPVPPARPAPQAREDDQ